MADATLKPCPDCKSQPRIAAIVRTVRTVGKPDEQQTLCEVACLKCAEAREKILEAKVTAATPAAKIESVEVARAVGDTPEKAIANWNTHAWLSVYVKIG